jgi:hypothetical protein
MTVEGEVLGCDVWPCAAKSRRWWWSRSAFGLALVLQGIDRLNLTNTVYLAIGVVPPRMRDMNKLCRRLGLGLMIVTATTVDVLLDRCRIALETPAPGRAAARRARAPDRRSAQPIVYRQRRYCAATLASNGQMTLGGDSRRRRRAERRQDHAGRLLRLVRAGRPRHVHVVAGGPPWAGTVRPSAD